MDYREMQRRNGRKGGNTTFERHGSEHMKKISKKGVKARHKKQQQQVKGGGD